jgi:hypothetical protein
MAARSAGQLRSLHHLLWSLRSVPTSGRLGRDRKRTWPAPMTLLCRSSTCLFVCVHQHGACTTRNIRQSMSRSRGGLASKIHAVVDTNSPIREVEPLRASSPDVRLWGGAVMPGRAVRSKFTYLLVT